MTKRIEILIVVVVLIVLAFVFGCKDEPASRVRQEIYARSHGYFWLPCPICRKEFGGHEESGGQLWYPNSGPLGSAKMTCPNCVGDWKIIKADKEPEPNEPVIYGTGNSWTRVLPTWRQRLNEPEDISIKVWTDCGHKRLESIDDYWALNSTSEISNKGILLQGEYLCLDCNCNITIATAVISKRTIK